MIAKRREKRVSEGVSCGDRKVKPCSIGGTLEHFCEYERGHRGKHFCCESASWPRALAALEGEEAKK